MQTRMGFLGEKKAKHVMFVDDSPVLLRTVKSFVPKQYRVSLAANGEQVFNVLEHDKPDLIFMDYEMPEMSGRDILERIRERDDMRDTPVVFLTAQSGENYIDNVVGLYPAGYVLKPPSADRILNIIEKYLK